MAEVFLFYRSEWTPQNCNIWDFEILSEDSKGKIKKYQQILKNTSREIKYLTLTNRYWHSE